MSVALRSEYPHRCAMAVNPIGRGIRDHDRRPGSFRAAWTRSCRVVQTATTPTNMTEAPACRYSYAGAIERRSAMAPSQVVAYRVDDETVVQFEIDPVAGFTPAGSGEVAGRVWDAAGPAIDAARALLARVKLLNPHGVEVKLSWQPSRSVASPGAAPNGS